jgi:hypothetical protein
MVKKQDAWRYFVGWKTQELPSIISGVMLYPSSFPSYEAGGQKRWCVAFRFW